MTIKPPIFLDHCSTTPVDESVLEAMLPYFRDKFGNPNTSHPELGGVAERAVRKAREQLADLLVCHPNEVVWTSGATESNNLAILGFAKNVPSNKRHVITQVTEHSAVLEPIRQLEFEGWKVSWLPVDHTGLIDVDQLKNEITDETALVSIMWGNNEIGTIQDVAAIGQTCKEFDITWHCDSAQTVGKIEVNLSEIPADFLTVSAHKMYGPKGVGALYVRDLPKRNDFSSHVFGGGQEKGFRSGTLNVPGIVGFGHASEIAFKDGQKWIRKIRSLRKQFEEKILNELDQVSINGSRNRLPHISNMAFARIENEDVLNRMPELVVSTGSACHAASFEPSHVLKALGNSSDDNSLRFGFGKDNTIAEIEFAAELVVKTINTCRRNSYVPSKSSHSDFS